MHADVESGSQTLWNRIDRRRRPLTRALFDVAANQRTFIITFVRLQVIVFTLSFVSHSCDFSAGRSKTWMLTYIVVAAAMLATVT